VRATLEEMNRSRIGVSPLVDRSEGQNMRYAITARGQTILHLRERYDERSNSSGSPAPSLSRQTSAEAHRQRNGRLILEDNMLFEDDDGDIAQEDVQVASESQEVALAAVALDFDFVPAYPQMAVMLGCLGRSQPTTFSRLFCPLIFLAANRYHVETPAGMAFWRKRFSHWDEWVFKLRESGVHLLLIPYDEGTAALMYGQQGAYRIPHYTPSAQVDVIARANIDAEVDACAYHTFRGTANPSARLQGASLDVDTNDADDQYRSMSVPTPQSNGADSNAARIDPPMEDIDDENDHSTWWATI